MPAARRGTYANSSASRVPSAMPASALACQAVRVQGRSSSRSTAWWPPRPSARRRSAARNAASPAGHSPAHHAGREQAERHGGEFLAGAERLEVRLDIQPGREFVQHRAACSATAGLPAGAAAPPRPSGTGAGNSRPTGHSSSSASPPALPTMNQRSRSDCQRSIPPARCTRPAERRAGYAAGRC